MDADPTSDGHAHAHAHNDMSEEEHERQHFQTVIAVFRNYAEFVNTRIAKAQSDYEKLDPRHQQLLTHFPKRIEALYEAVDANQQVLFEVTKPHRIFLNDDALDTEKEMEHADGKKFTIDEHKKVRSTLKQFVRDWSEEGAEERSQCYQPIVDAVTDRFKDVTDKSQLQVLVPGAGLGRLAFEFAKLGFSCEGNEFSFYMLVASNFILNRSGPPVDIYPWVHEFSNHIDADDQYRAISIPDVEPAKHLGNGSAEFSMTAGDFLDCYVTEEKFDAVASCYFIDTAKNIIQYIERIYDILKPGGVFVNMGPLLYHFSDSPELSIELSYEEVKDVMLTTGFVIEEERRGVHSNYIGNTKSLYNISYECVFFIASKPSIAQNKS